MTAGDLIWPAVIALIATVGIVVALPYVLGVFSEKLGQAVGGWLRRRAVAIFGGLCVAHVVWWNWIRKRVRR